MFYLLTSKTTFESFQEIDIRLRGDVGTSILDSLADNVTKGCLHCNCDTSHSVIKNIWQQPKISIIRVQRFRQMSTGRIHKDSDKLTLKETFSIPNFKASLIGSVSHVGSSTTSGHYISYVKVEDGWYSCSDNSITKTNFCNISDSRDCYLLFCLLTT